MTVQQLTKLLNAKPINVADENREVTCGYCGDLLSFVMGRAPEDSAWFTIMTNVNVCAVASLANVAVVVLCEGCAFDEIAVERATQKGINLIATEHDVFEAVKRFVNEN